MLLAACCVLVGCLSVGVVRVLSAAWCSLVAVCWLMRVGCCVSSVCLVVCAVNRCVDCVLFCSISACCVLVCVCCVVVC